MWGSNNSTSLSNSFVGWLQNSNFVMLNTSNPTYTSYMGTNSLLDLTLCSTSIYHQVDCFVSDSTFESDHNPVITTWSLLGQTSKTIKTIDWNSIMKNTSEILSSTNSDLHNVMHKVSGIIKQNTKHSVLPEQKTWLTSLTMESAAFSITAAQSPTNYRTHFKICDTIQTIALRVALGLPIWTPNIVLRKLRDRKFSLKKSRD
ncbi:hypothetical protein AVEN_247598-1 [Araneus ventricosus]|uniref:Endonuclease/exonuclease/phosphatase domain-containing protein n=1 Tax=Araneus ventricosus TaxID=182803 RepID=A0A4Y2D9Z3_ARAVE|nr:hypothetical protein AVEN_247598-1 [Araneus ventricosus]